MAAKFDTSSRRSLASAGWAVATTIASRSEVRGDRTATAIVTAAGQWTATIEPTGRHSKHREVVALGQDSHPCAAAMDANEILWAFRDGRRVPDHLGGKLTDAGRAVL